MKDLFKGCLDKSYKPIRFHYYDYDITLQIVPGWEYMYEFNAENKNGEWLFYCIFNLDNSYTTKKMQREKLEELLSDIKTMYDKKPKYEQLTIFDL